MFKIYSGVADDPFGETGGSTNGIDILTCYTLFSLFTSNVTLFTDLAVAYLEGDESVRPVMVVPRPGKVRVEVIGGVEECLHLQVLQPAPGVIVLRGLPDRHLDQSELSIETDDQSERFRQLTQFNTIQYNKRLVRAHP